MRRRLCVSSSSGFPLLATVTSLLARASAHAMGFPNTSNPSVSSAAVVALSGDSYTTKAWPLALTLVLMMMSTTVPYSPKMAASTSLARSGLTRSSMLRT